MDLQDSRYNSIMSSNLAAKLIGISWNTDFIWELKIKSVDW